jgi:hypothetical protein
MMLIEARSTSKWLAASRSRYGRLDVLDAGVLVDVHELPDDRRSIAVGESDEPLAGLVHHVARLVSRRKARTAS